MNDIQARYKDQGVVVIAVNLDESRAAAEKFLQQMEVDFTVVFDQQAKTAQAYEVMAMPSSYLIDQKGKIVSKHLGFRQKDKLLIENAIQDLLRDQA